MSINQESINNLVLLSQKQTVVWPVEVDLLAALGDLADKMFFERIEYVSGGPKPVTTCGPYTSYPPNDPEKFRAKSRALTISRSGA